jgi:hypothetical protein
MVWLTMPNASTTVWPTDQWRGVDDLGEDDDSGG